MALSIRWEIGIGPAYPLGFILSLLFMNIKTTLLTDKYEGVASRAWGGLAYRLAEDKEVVAGVIAIVQLFQKKKKAHNHENRFFVVKKILSFIYTAFWTI